MLSSCAKAACCERKFLHPRHQFDVPLSGHIRNVRQVDGTINAPFLPICSKSAVSELTKIKSLWFHSEPPGSSMLLHIQARTYGKWEVAKQHST